MSLSAGPDNMFQEDLQLLSSAVHLECQEEHSEHETIYINCNITKPFQMLPGRCHPLGGEI